MRKTLELAITALLLFPALIWVLAIIGGTLVAAFGILSIIGWAVTGIASIGIMLGTEALGIAFWAIEELRSTFGELVWLVLLAVPVAFQYMWYRHRLEDLQQK